MVISNDKVFYNPGDLVRVKHDINNVPLMYVVEKVTRSFVNRETRDKEVSFIGIKCRWFDSNKQLCEAIFSTKDLEHI